MDKGKNQGRAVKTVGLMMAATVIAKLLGMLRGVLLAGAYGTLPQANAFTAASKLPLAFFDMLLAAAVLGCFIPAYNSFKDDGEKTNPEADRFACIFLNFIIVVCGILALVGIVFADLLISWIGSGLSYEMHQLAVTLTRIMFPMVIFTGSAYTLVGLLQSKGSFIAPAMISAISNGGVVVYLAFINPLLGDNGIYGLAVAYLLSWLIQLLTLIIPLHKAGFRYKLLLDFKNPTLKKALKMAPPIMIGSWLSPMGVLLGQYFASRITAAGGISGAASIFDYANNIYIIIAGILTYSICNYTFPKISKLASSEDALEFYQTVRDGLKSAMFIVVPFTAAALILAGEGVAVVYMRGEFTPTDAMNTARVLKLILPATPFFAVTELLSRVFYSKNQPRPVMYSVILGIAVNFGVALFLTWQGDFGISAVGIATAAGQIATAITLIGVSLKKFKGIYSRKLLWELIYIFIGGILVFFACFGLSYLIGASPYTSSLMRNVLSAVIIFVPSAGIYLGWTYLCKLVYTRHFSYDKNNF